MTIDSAYRDTAQAINSTIVPIEIPEENDKFANEMYKVYTENGKDGLLPYLSQVTSVAEQCPSAGGPSVFIMRTYASLFNDSIEYDDENICLLAGYYRQSKDSLIKTAITSNDFIIIPNPSKDYFDVKIMKAEKGLCSVLIFDGLGKLQQQNKLDCSVTSHRFTTDKLVPGVYQIKLITKSGSVFVKKLVIVK